MAEACEVRLRLAIVGREQDRSSILLTSTIKYSNSHHIEKRKEVSRLVMDKDEMKKVFQEMIESDEVKFVYYENGPSVLIYGKQFEKLLDMFDMEYAPSAEVAAKIDEEEQKNKKMPEEHLKVCSPKIKKRA